MNRSIAPLLLALCLLVLSALPAHAVEIPDLDAQGSVQVQMKTDSTPVPGGSLTLYRVGAIVQTDTGFGFVPIGEFEGYPGTLEDLGKTTAAELAKYAASNGISGEGKTIDETGTAVFDPLPHCCWRCACWFCLRSRLMPWRSRIWTPKAPSGCR